MAEIVSIRKLLNKELNLPGYQRPYKWTDKNVAALLSDIDNAIAASKKYGKDKFKYRIGTIILHNNKEKNTIDIVDGQQRTTTLLLLHIYISRILGEDCDVKLLKNGVSNTISQDNIHKNYSYIKDWFNSKAKDKVYLNEIKDSLESILEVIVITVNSEAEAFQLFDSQNSRGKELDPHDLLKAYHLREMKNTPYDMRHAVTTWEAVDVDSIRDLFADYLFPIRLWSNDIKSYAFTANEIDIYKGIYHSSLYPYAKRASRAMPYFQIAESFIAGNDFFEMVSYYLRMLEDIKVEINDNAELKEINEILTDNSNNTSVGFCHAKELFYCAVLCFYDRFKIFDVQVIKKLFTWAFMLRVDLENLGFGSINNYAVGWEEGKYTNYKAMFNEIRNARLHTEISNIKIEISRDNKAAKHKKWNDLYNRIKDINNYGRGGV